MEENYAILKNSTDQDGNPLKIIRIPIPDPIYVEARPEDEAYAVQESSPDYRDGTVFPHGSPVLLVPALSYCNFLISNDVVVAQKYWEKGMPESIRKKDEAALTALKKAFPNRKIVTVPQPAGQPRRRRDSLLHTAAAEVAGSFFDRKK